MKFKEFIQEAKMLKLTSKEYAVVQTISKTYISNVQKKTDLELNKISKKLSRKIYERLFFDPKNTELHLRYIHIGSYTVEERKEKKEKNIDVFIILNAPTTDNEGLYNSDTEEIYIFHDTIKEYTKQQIVDIVTHEIIHAVQHYRQSSEKYNQAVKQPEPTTEYYSEPIEFEATLSSIINSLYNTTSDYIKLIKKYYKLDNKSLQNFYILKYNQFLRSILKFIETPVTVFDTLKQDDIPVSIYNKLDFFKKLNQNKIKKYRLALFKAVEKMKKDLFFVEKYLKS